MLTHYAKHTEFQYIMLVGSSTYKCIPTELLFDQREKQRHGVSNHDPLDGLFCNLFRITIMGTSELLQLRLLVFSQATFSILHKNLLDS